MVFFLISSMVLGLLNQLQIFSQLHLIELFGLLTGLGLLVLRHLIYPKLLTGFGMLVFFTNSLHQFLSVLRYYRYWANNKSSCKPIQWCNLSTSPVLLFFIIKAKISFHFPDWKDRVCPITISYASSCNQLKSPIVCFIEATLSN